MDVDKKQLRKIRIELAGPNDHQGMTHTVKIRNKVVAVACNEDYAKLLALTIRRVELIHELIPDSVHEMLAVLVDLITHIQNGRWTEKAAAKAKKKR